MKKTAIFTFLFCFFTFGICGAMPFALDVATQGSLKNETAARIHEPRQFTKIRNQLLLVESGKFSEDIKFKVSGRFFYDPLYDATDTFSKQVASDQKYEVELRDTYIDYSNGSFDLRVGKQQIVWGEAVGLFFADVVNAKDLREFVLPDFDMIRIPQWGVDAEYTKEDFHFEWLFLPVLEFDKRGVAGSEFAFPYPVPENTSYTAADPQDQKNNFKNSETGFRVSYLTDGWDFSGFYLYTWDKSPVEFRTIDSGTYQFHPGYRRLNVFGSTFAKEINDIVMKGELVYSRKGNFSIIDSADSDGVIQRDFIDYLLGADYTFFGSLDTNIQFMQRLIFDFDKRIVNEKSVNNSLSLRFNRGFLDNALEAELLVITSLMEKDLMYRPKITYTVNHNWKVKCGLDIFDGNATGIFGKFEKKSRAYIEFTRSF